MNREDYIWSSEENDILKQAYINKTPKNELLKLLPRRSYSGIKHRAKILGIKKTRLQTKNESFFEIPNEMNCSIAGMIASDGNIQSPHKKNGWRIILGLCRNDEVILNNIIKTANSNANISRQSSIRTIKTPRNLNPPEKEYLFSYLTFSNAQKWASDLQRHWNITENKSLTLTAPNFNELNLSLAYILGIINGDGTIGIQKTKNKQYFYLRLLGTRNLLEWAKNRFEEALSEKIGGEVHLERKDGNVYLLQVNGIRAVKLFEKMKVLNCLQLERKWQNPQILKLIDEYKQKYPQFFVSKPL